MNEWTVVSVLVTVVGLFAAVGGPVLKLNTTITRLQTVLDDLQKDFDRSQNKASETHRRLFEHNEEQDRRLANHESRILHLENAKTEEQVWLN